MIICDHCRQEIKILEQDNRFIILIETQTLIPGNFDVLYRKTLFTFHKSCFGKVFIFKYENISPNICCCGHYASYDEGGKFIVVSRFKINNDNYLDIRLRYLSYHHLEHFLKYWIGGKIVGV